MEAQKVFTKVKVHIAKLTCRMTMKKNTNNKNNNNNESNIPTSKKKLQKAQWQNAIHK